MFIQKKGKSHTFRVVSLARRGPGLAPLGGWCRPVSWWGFCPTWRRVRRVHPGVFWVSFPRKNNRERPDFGRFCGRNNTLVLAIFAGKIGKRETLFLKPRLTILLVYAGHCCGVLYRSKPFTRLANMRGSIDEKERNRIKHSIWHVDFHTFSGS